MSLGSVLNDNHIRRDNPFKDFAVIDSSSDGNQNGTDANEFIEKPRLNTILCYAPITGLWVGPWLLGVNVSFTYKYFEVSSSLAYHSKTSIVSQNVFFDISVGGRYTFPSLTNSLFYIHGLVGYVNHRESSPEEGSTLSGTNSTIHSGICFIPGLGIDSKKPSKIGYRFGLNFIACPGYDTNEWPTRFSGAFQLTLGLIF